MAANAAGDRAARDTLLHRADAATHAAGAPEKLSVTLTGDLADKIKASNGQHYLFVDKGELTLAVQLGQARFEYGQRSVTRSGTRTVKAGLKENPDFKIRKHECQKLENDALNKEDSCRRNGGFAGTCDWARKYRQRAGECWGRMKGMNDLVEDTREERIDYPATEFFAKAAGSVTIAKDGGAPQTQDLTASTSNLGHGSVPALGLSGSSGRKVTEDEIDGSYRVEAMSKVENLMASGRSGLKQKLREQVTAAPADLSAASLVRLCLVGGGTPANEFLDAQDSKYELPTRRVLETLLAAHNKQPCRGESERAHVVEQRLGVVVAQPLEAHARDGRLTAVPQDRVAQRGRAAVVQEAGSGVLFHEAQAPQRRRAPLGGLRDAFAQRVSERGAEVVQQQVGVRVERHVAHARRRGR